ncbi:uncharacterized protein LOC141852382 isoform X2 [Brevipalpus obovatus]|uniref:uncharacterized protein LOC141852382 isoform X2 n=1 Tax=Brevipalpus obovatus TaxID=246614 RepID=UPI003D9E1982
MRAFQLVNQDVGQVSKVCVKTGSMSTDSSASNRSSLCTNDAFVDSSLFKGPFIGRGLALVDQVPCPYDKDALSFKKGDLVNIIAKNDSGTWIGMANGKIGHFKFITVEEKSSIGMRSSITSTVDSNCGIVKSDSQSSSSSSSITTITITNSSTSNNNINPSSSYQVPSSSHESTSLSIMMKERCDNAVQRLISTTKISNHESLRNLLKLIDLEEFNYLGSLESESFNSLESLANLQDASHLEKMNITRKDHQELFLYIASLLTKMRDDKALTDLQGEMSSLDLNGENTSSKSNKSAQSTPSYANFPFLLNSSSPSCAKASYIDITTTTTSLRSREASDGTPSANNNSNTNKRSESFSSSTSTSSSKSVKSTSQSHVVKKLAVLPACRRKRDRKMSDSEGIKRAQSGGNILSPSSDITDCESSNYGSMDWKALDTNALIKKLEHGYEMRSARCCEAKGPSRIISSSRSVFDLKYHDSPSSEEPVAPCEHSTKKRLKKLLYSNPKNLNSISFGDNRRIGLTSKPLSSSLLETLTSILREENIDLTSEPYSDSSGFCGIPPALVQRYGEELERDVYDIAETLDHIRLSQLLAQSGKQGIPNDFLADSCNAPGTDGANYESLHSWLLSLGLPMYWRKFKEKGRTSLWHVIPMREDDLISCGITDKRHLRFLTTAIGALSVNQHRIGRS